MPFAKSLPKKGVFQKNEYKNNLANRLIEDLISVKISWTFIHLQDQFH